MPILNPTCSLLSSKYLPLTYFGHFGHEKEKIKHPSSSYNACTYFTGMHWLVVLSIFNGTNKTWRDEPKIKQQ